MAAAPRANFAMHAFGSFDSHDICESYRKQSIAEQEGDAQESLKTLAVCVPESAVPDFSSSFEMKFHQD